MKVGLGIGTTKGGYVLLSDIARRRWKKYGPFLKDESVNSLTYSPRTRKLYAATLTEGVFASENLGRTWRPLSRGLSVRKVWTVEVDPKTSSTLYAGTHYGHLFRSKDGGKSWQEVVGLHKAPKRNEWGIDWTFGTTGLCIHTIRLDSAESNRIYIVSSGSGPYRSDDAGETWKILQEGVLTTCPVGEKPDAPHIPKEERSLELQKHLNMEHTCTHNFVLSRKNRDVIYQQNHCGVYRSIDAGER